MQTRSAINLLINNYRAVLKKCFWANVMNRRDALKSLSKKVNHSALAGLLVAAMNVATPVAVATGTAAAAIVAADMMTEEVSATQPTVSADDETQLSFTGSVNQMVTDYSRNSSDYTLTFNVTGGYFGAHANDHQIFMQNIVIDSLISSDGYGAMLTTFGGKVTGSGVFTIQNKGLDQDFVFTGNVTGYSGNITSSQSFLNGESSLGVVVKEGILQFGGYVYGSSFDDVAQVYDSSATVTDGVVENISGTGSITTSSVLRYNYTGAADNNSSLGINNSSISARYLEFKGGADYVVDCSVTGNNTTASNNTLKISAGSVTFNNTVSNFGNIVVAKEGSLSIGKEGSLTLSGTINLGSTITNAGTLILSGKPTINLSEMPTMGGTYFVAVNSGSLSDGTTTLDWANLTNDNYRNYFTLQFAEELTSRNTLKFTADSGFLAVAVEGTAADLVWANEDGSIWSTTDTSTAWTMGSDQSDFVDGDNVTFNVEDDTVTVSGTVAPGKVSVNANTTFDGEGTISVANANLTIAEGKTLTLDAVTTLDFGTEANGKLTQGQIVGAGTLVWGNSGTSHGTTVALSDNFTGTVKLSGNISSNSFNIGGATKLVSNGVWFWGDSGQLNEVTADVEVVSGTTLKLGAENTSTGMNFSGDVSAKDATIEVASGSHILSGDSVEVGTMNISGGTIKLKNSSWSDSVATNINLSANGASITFSKSGDSETTYNVGEMKMTSVDNFNRYITVDEGVTVNATAVTNGWGIGALTVNGTLNLTGILKYATGNNWGATNNNAITGSGTIKATGLILGNVGTYNIGGGIRLEIGAEGIKDSSGSWGNGRNLGNATLVVAESWTSAVAANHSFNLVDNDVGTTLEAAAEKTATFNGAFSGSGKLTKTGEGTITLAGGYSAGDLTVQAGTLALSGAIVLDSTVNVAADATLNISGITSLNLSNFAYVVEDNVYTYALINGEGTIEGWTEEVLNTLMTNNAVTGLVSSTRGAEYDISTEGVIKVTLNSYELTWNGTDDDLVWDSGDTDDWTDGANNQVYQDGDTVVFNKDVTINVAQAVAPTKVIIDGATVQFTGEKITASQGIIIEEGGTLKLTGNDSANYVGNLGKVIVNAGGILDLNGSSGDMDPGTIEVVLNGGKYANYGGNAEQGKKQLPTLTLTADSQIGGTGEIAFINSGYNGHTMDLGGFTLEKVDSNTVHFTNATLTNGTLKISEGVINDLGGNQHKGMALNGANILVDEGKAGTINANLNISGGEQSIESNGTLNIATLNVNGGNTTVSGDGTTTITNLRVTNNGTSLKIESGSVVNSERFYGSAEGDSNSISSTINGILNITGDGTGVSADSGAFLMANGGGVHTITVENGGVLNLASAGLSNRDGTGKLTIGADGEANFGEKLHILTNHTDWGGAHLYLNGGTLNVGADENGVGISTDGKSNVSVNLNSGTVGSLADSWSSEIDFALGGAITFDTTKKAINESGKATAVADGESTITLSGAISGNGSLTKVGAGELILSGANTYAGGTEVKAGTLNLTGSVSSAVSVASGATLDLAGSVGGAVTLAEGALLNVSGATATVGGLTLNGEATIKLGSSTTGLALTSGATLNGVDSAIFDLDLSTDENGQKTVQLITGGVSETIELDKNNFLNNGVALSRRDKVTTSVADGVLSVTYTKAQSYGDLTWKGVESDVWSASNEVKWTSATADDEVLFENGDGVIFTDADSDKQVTISGKVAPASLTDNVGITFSGEESTDAELAMDGGELKTTAGTTVFDQTVKVSGTFTKAGAGTLSIANGENIALTWNEGGLTFAGVVSGTVTVADNFADAAFNTSVDVSANMVIGSGASVDFTATNDVTVSGVISGAGSVEFKGDKVITLSGANTLTGGVTIAGGTTVKMANRYAFGANGNAVTVGSGATVYLHGDSNEGIGQYTYTLQGGTLIYATDSAAMGVNWAQFKGTSDSVTDVITLTADSTLDINQTLGFVSAGHHQNRLNLDGKKLTKSGSGTLALCNTTISAGTFEIANGEVTIWKSDAGKVSTAEDANIVLSGGKLSLAGHSFTVNSLASGESTTGNVELGAGTLTVSGGTFAGVISGSGSLVKNGTDTLELTGANTYGGETVINAGTLKVSGAGKLGAGDVTVADGATLDLANDATISSLLYGNGTIKVGSSLEVKSMVNGHFSGTYEVAENAKLKVGASEQFHPAGGGGTTINLAQGATLEFATGHNDSHYEGTIEGAGALVVTNGVVVLGGSNANTFTGGTTIAEGATITTNNASALGTGDVANAGTLNLKVESTLSGAVTNSGILNFAAATTLSGAVSNAGTLNFNVDTTLSGELSGAGALNVNANTTLANVNADYSGAVTLAAGKALTANVIFANTTGDATTVYNYSADAATVDLTDWANFKGQLNNTSTSDNDKVLTINTNDNQDATANFDFSNQIGEGWDKLVKTGADTLVLGNEGVTIELSAIQINEGTVAIKSGTTLDFGNVALGDAFIDGGTDDVYVELQKGVIFKSQDGELTLDDDTFKSDFIGKVSETGITFFYALGTWELTSVAADAAALAAGSTGSSTLITYKSDANLVITEDFGLGNIGRYGTGNAAELEINAGSVEVTEDAHLSVQKVTIDADASFVQSFGGALTYEDGTATGNAAIVGEGTYVLKAEGITTTISSDFTGTLSVQANNEVNDFGGATIVEVGENATLTSDEIFGGEINGVGTYAVSGGDASIAYTADKYAGFTGTLDSTDATATLELIGSDELTFNIGDGWDSVEVVNELTLGDKQTLGDNNVVVAEGAILNVFDDFTRGANKVTVNGELNSSVLIGNVDGDGTYNLSADQEITVDLSTALTDFEGDLNNTGTTAVKLVVSGTDNTLNFNVGDNWDSVVIDGVVSVAGANLGAYDVLVKSDSALNLGKGYYGNAITVEGTLNLDGDVQLASLTINDESFIDLGGFTLDLSGATLDGFDVEGFENVVNFTDGTLIIDNDTIFGDTSAADLNASSITWAKDLIAAFAQEGVKVELQWDDRLSPFSEIKTSSYIGEDGKVDYEAMLEDMGMLTGNDAVDGEAVTIVIDTEDFDIAQVNGGDGVNGMEDDIYEQIVITEGSSAIVWNMADVGADLLTVDKDAELFLGENVANLGELEIMGLGDIVTDAATFAAGGNLVMFNGTLAGNDENTLDLSGENITVNMTIEDFAEVVVNSGNVTLNSSIDADTLSVAQGATAVVTSQFAFDGKLTGAGTLVGSEAFFSGTGSKSDFSGSVEGDVTLSSTDIFANASVNTETLTVQGTGTVVKSVDTTNLELDVSGVKSGTILTVTDSLVATKTSIVGDVVNGTFTLIDNANLNSLSVEINGQTVVLGGEEVKGDSFIYSLVKEGNSIILNAMTMADSNGNVVSEFNSAPVQANSIQSTMTSANMLRDTITGRLAGSMINSQFHLDGVITSNLLNPDGMTASTNTIQILGNEVNYAATSVWGEALYSHAEYDGSDNNVSSEEDSYGGLIGFERAYSDLNYGMFVGAVSSEVDGNDGSNVDSESIYFGGYVGMRRGIFIANFGAMGGYMMSDATRNGVHGELTGDYDSYMANAFAEAGVLLELTEAAYLRATVGLQYTYVDSEDYDEKGTGGNHVDACDFDSLTAGIDVRLGYRFSRSFVEARLGVTAELLDTEIESTFNMIDNPSALFSAQGGELDSSKVIFGIEAGHNFTEHFELRAGGLFEIGDQNERFTGNVRLIYTF